MDIQHPNYSVDGHGRSAHWALSVSYLGRLIAGCSLFALFPFIFFYHLLAAAGFFPLFLGGGWGVCLAAVAILLSPLVALHTRLRLPWPFVAICVSVTLISSYNYFLGDPTFQRSPLLLFQSAALLCGWVALFSTGYFLRSSRMLTRVIGATWVLMSVITIALVDPATNSFIATTRFHALHAPQVADYQTFAMTYVFVAMYCLACARSRYYQALIVVFSTLVLYALSSRSELYGFVAVSVIWWSGQLLARRLVVFLATPLAIILVFATFFTVTSVLSPASKELTSSLGQATETATIDATPHITAPLGDVIEGIKKNYRQAEILSPASSQSMSMRIDLLAKGWADIRTQPIWGVYGGQTRDGGDFGMYIHNALEMWRTFGVVPFCLLALVMVWSTSRAARQVFLTRTNHHNVEWLYAFYVSAFCTLLIVATKSPVTWPLPALGWGLVAGLIANTDQTQRSARPALPASWTSGGRHTIY